MKPFLIIAKVDVEEPSKMHLKALMGILNLEIGGTWFHLILPVSQYLQERLLPAQPMQQNQLEGHSPTTFTALKEKYLGKNYM
eukprot:gene1104-448_t